MPYVKKIVVSIFLIFNFLNVFSQRNPVTTAVGSLMISPDARASGLGEQGVATSPDAFSQHWNPAKYIFLENKSGFASSYTPYMRDIGVEDAFLANINYYNIIDERSSWSTSFKYFTIGEIQIIPAPQDIPFLEYPSVFSLDGSYTLKLSDFFSMAVTGRFFSSNLKYKSQDLDPSSTNSFAVDISGFYQSEERAYENFNGMWRAGFNISNLGPKVKYNELGDADFIPTNLKIGSSFDLIFDSSNKLSINLELNKLLVPTPLPVLNSDDQITEYDQPDISFLSGIFKSFGDAPGGFSEEINEINLSLGLEYDYNDSFALRVGYFSEHKDKGGRKFMTYGTGFSIDEINLDLSYLQTTSSSNLLTSLDGTLRFSFSYNFN
jgi:hypothetical protein